VGRKIGPRGDDAALDDAHAGCRQTSSERRTMIRPGERLENPVTGEVLIFRETASQTGGELVRVETIVQPGGFVAAAHVHPAQTERFVVLAGTVDFSVGGDTIRASEGDEVVVSPGTPHRFSNAGDEEARFLCEIRPALEFESLIETMLTLAAEGKTGTLNPDTGSLGRWARATPSRSRDARGCRPAVTAPHRC
jgi:quercetin dioxygenase-like cupin family protein